VTDPGAPRWRFPRRLSAISLAALAVRIGYTLVVGPRLSVGFDALWYELQAGTLAAGHGYVDPDAFYRTGTAVATANFPPLWPALLAAANRLGVDTELGYALVGAVVGTVTVPVAALIGRRVAGPAVGLVAAALVALSPALVAADGSLMADSLYVLALALATLAALRAQSLPTPGRFALMGVTLGVAALARSDALIVAPVLVAATAWAAREPVGRRRVALGGLALAGTVAVVLPWSVLASVRLGSPVVVSSNSASLLEGANCATTYAGDLLGAWDPGCLVETRRPGVREADWAGAARAAGLAHALDHPGRLPVVVAVRVLRAWGLWAPLQQARLDVDETRHRDWQVGSWVAGLALSAVALPGAVLLARRAGRAAAPLAAVVGGSTVVVALSWGNPRFLLAAVPALAVSAATTIVVTVSGVAEGRHRLDAGRAPGARRWRPPTRTPSRRPG